MRVTDRDGGMNAAQLSYGDALRRPPMETSLFNTKCSRRGVPTVRSSVTFSGTPAIAAWRPSSWKLRAVPTLQQEAHDGSGEIHYDEGVLSNCDPSA
jgi:hypothetical protein